MKIIAANNLHILQRLVISVPQISNILQCPMLWVYINTNYLHFETCHAMYQYHLVKCIIPICIFTATTTDKSCSCPHYHGIPQILSPSPPYYRGFYPHSHGNIAVIVPITTVTEVLPPSPSPFYSLTPNLKTKGCSRVKNWCERFVGRVFQFSGQKVKGHISVVVEMDSHEICQHLADVFL